MPGPEGWLGGLGTQGKQASMCEEWACSVQSRESSGGPADDEKCVYGSHVTLFTSSGMEMS